jgi:RND family efflux transporter MFP subunit
MNDKSALLGQLKIDRSFKPERRKLPWKWLLLGLALLSALAVVVLRAAPTPLVKVVAARAASSGDGAGSVLDATGYVVARRQATVSAKITGKVREILIEEGQHVQAGQVLARLDDSNARAALGLAQSQWMSARAGLAEVQAQLLDAQRQLKRTQELTAKGMLSQAALDTAQANMDTLGARLERTRSDGVVAERGVAVYRQQLDDTVVHAPFGGVITVKNAQPGEMISPLSAGGAGTRTGIGTLVDMDSLEIEVDVNENFINRVQAGQPVSAKLNAYPDWTIPCEVIAVIPAADRSKATVKVRVGIKTKDARILPDMGARVSFLNDAQTPAEAPKGVWIPEDAVQATGETGVVFVLNGDKLERRAVKLGGRGSEGQQVISGLRTSEKVVSGDLTKLSDGLKVKLAE